MTPTDHEVPVPTTTRAAALLAAVLLVAAGCGGTEAADDADAASVGLDLGDRDALVAAAEGQSVQWWMYGGDARINGYVDEHVVPAAAELGVELERVEVADTADAVNRVLAEVRAGEDDGSVDLVWINGANFADGAEAGIWLEGWAGELPNARYLDPASVEEDFGVPVEGRESPWSRALLTFAHDQERTPTPPADLDGLLAYARENPGRLTYPAPPDFTGSAFVRQVVTLLGEEEAFAWLQELQPLLWREGRTHPADEAELNGLFGDGEVDVALSYDPAFVETGVAQGQFPDTARPFALAGGTLQNVSYVTVPENAGDRAGALLVADLLLEPELQATKADPDVLGVPTVLDLDRLEPGQRELFATATASPYLLDQPEDLLEELSAARVGELDQRWLDEVLR